MTQHIINEAFLSSFKKQAYLRIDHWPVV